MNYLDFARYYDELTENVDYPARAEYLLNVMSYFRHAPGRVLDLACGTGSMTVELAKRGIDIFGVDASGDMLTQAYDKAYDNDLELLFVRQSMQALELPGLVDTVICTLDSVNHITSKKTLTRAFSRVSQYLADDGLFIFDANTIYKHKVVLGDNCYIYDIENVFCAWQNNYDPEDNRVVITLDFFESQGDMYLRSTEQFSERAYSREEMTEILSAAGLEITEVFGDMTLLPPSETEQREIYAVRKIRNE